MTELVSIDNIKFIKLIYTKYNNNKIIDLVQSCDIYKDNDNLIKIDNFICELYEDLSLLCYNWDFEKIIEIFFTKNNHQLKMSYSTIFNKLFTFETFGSGLEKYVKFLEITDFELFKKIIDKYSNIKLSDKQIPIEPTTNIILSSDNFNISNVLMSRIINEICNSFSKKSDFIEKLTLDKLELLLSNVNKINSFLENILIDRTYPNNANSKINSLIVKTQIDFNNMNLREFNFVLSKLLVENNVFANFNQILDIAYCRSSLSFIEMVSVLRLDLLDIDLPMLKKILYYGRFEVFEKIYWNVPWKILSILEANNPFDLTDCKCNYSEDINGGSHWGNDEHERPIIGKKKHKELFDMILSIAKEKNYSHVVWTDEIKSQWIKISIANDVNKDNSQDSRYFVSYTELKEIFGYEFDFGSKKSISQHIELFGKSYTWDIIKSKCDEKFLDLLFD